MVTEEEIAQVLSRYQKFLQTLEGVSEEEEEELTSPPEEDHSNLIEELGTDLGMTAEVGKSQDVLLKDLGLTGSVLPLMRKARHRLPYLLWTAKLSEPDARQKQQQVEETTGPLPDDWEPLRLKYHQIAGVHSILHRLTASSNQTLKEGILIADEVGVGKTAQALASIAMLVHLFSCQQESIAPGGMFGKSVLIDLDIN